MPQPADFSVTNSGSVAMVTPLSPAAREWVEENVQVEPWAWMGLGFAVEPRLVEGLMSLAAEQGLEVPQ